MEAIPEYYRDKVGVFKTWFKIERFIPADKDVMSKCVVASSGKILGDASRHSMNPYFIINCDGNEFETEYIYMFESFCCIHETNTTL